MSTPTSHRVQSIVKNLPSDSKVQQLIDTDTGAWMETLIYDTFDESEPDAICSIPLCRLGTMDKMVRDLLIMEVF